MLRDLAQLGVERGLVLVAFEGAGEFGEGVRLTPRVRHGTCLHEQDIPFRR